MRRLILARGLGALGAVLGASIVSFVVLRLAPSNPARLILGPFATRAAVARLTRQLGLDQSIPAQYWHYIVQFLQGSWGYSYQAGESVSRLIFSRLGASVELALVAFIGAFCSAVAVALLITYRRKPWLDRLARGVSIVALGVPQFWLGLLLLIVLSRSLGLFPGPVGRLSPGVSPPPSVTGLYMIDALLAGQFATFADAVWHLLLPAFCLSFFAFGYLLRLLRASLLEVSREPYLAFARSKGLDRWRAFSRHALPNAFLPTLTASGLLFAQLLAGSVLVESVFNWPGVGQLVVTSIQRSDYGVVQAFILLSAVAYVIVNFIIDILYGVIDPRTRLVRAGQ